MGGVPVNALRPVPRHRDATLAVSPNPPCRAVSKPGRAFRQVTLEPAQRAVPCLKKTAPVAVVKVWQEAEMSYSRRSS